MGFILRRANPSDVAPYLNYLQDKETKRNFMSVPKTLSEARKELFNKKNDTFVIQVDGEFAGTIGMHDIIPNHKAILSYWLARKFRGQGIMTRATKLFTRYAFKKYKLRRIYGFVRTFNKASCIVLERAGYQLEGRLRKNKLRNGKYMDDFVYAKVR